MISKTKLDDSFPTAQFLIKGFSAPYRFDGSSKGGGLLLYIREDISSKILKWPLNGSYNPNKSQISHHLKCLNSVLDEYSKKYENYVFIGEFNVNTSNSFMKKFCSLNGSKI